MIQQSGTPEAEWGELFDVTARELRAASAIVQGFVRQDLLRARYLRAVAKALSLERHKRLFWQCTSSLSIAEEDLVGLEELFAVGPSGLADADARLEGAIERHRTVLGALAGASNFLGSPARSDGSHPEDFLRRSLDGAQSLVRRYAQLVPAMGDSALGAAGAHCGQPISAIVDFEHRSRPEAMHRVAENHDREAVCIFVKLPYWYAVRHRHLPLLAYEISLCWLRVVADRENGARAIRSLLAKEGRAAAAALETYVPSLVRSYGERFWAEAENAGYAYATRVLADSLALSVAGPAYLCSFAALRSAQLGPNDFIDPSTVPMRVRLACVLRACRVMTRKIAEDAPSSTWVGVFEDFSTQIEKDLELAWRTVAEPLADFERALVEAFRPLAEKVPLAGGSAWMSSSQSVDGDGIPEYAWREVEQVLSRSRAPGIEEFQSKAVGILGRAGWRVEAVPNVLWALCLHQRSTGQERRLMGRVAHPIWEATLRPDADGEQIDRGDYSELRFFRLAPGSSGGALLESLAEAERRGAPEGGQTRPAAGVSAVVGSWDLMTIYPGFSSSRRTHEATAPLAPRGARYFCESHIVCPIALPGESLAWRPPRASERTLVLSQFALSEGTSLRQFLEALATERDDLAQSGVRVECAFASLGWEEAVVVFSLEDHPQNWTAMSRVIWGLERPKGKRIARHSLTQVLLSPMELSAAAAPAAEGKAEASEAEVPRVWFPSQRARFSGVLEVAFSGATDVRSLASALRDLPEGLESTVEVPWGHADLVARWPIGPKTDLGHHWMAVGRLLQEKLALAATSSWSASPWL